MNIVSIRWSKIDGQRFTCLEFLKVHGNILSQIFDVPLIIWTIVVELQFSSFELKNILRCFDVRGSDLTFLLFNGCESSVNCVTISIQFHRHEIKLLLLLLRLLKRRRPGNGNNCTCWLGLYLIIEYFIITYPKVLSNAHNCCQKLSNTLFLIEGSNSSALYFYFLLLLHLKSFHIICIQLELL